MNERGAQRLRGVADCLRCRASPNVPGRQKGNTLRLRNGFLKQLQPLRFKLGSGVGDKSCDIPARMREARREPSPDGIVTER
jgi:hypothetical protein